MAVMVRYKLHGSYRSLGRANMAASRLRRRGETVLVVFRNNMYDVRCEDL